MKESKIAKEYKEDGYDYYYSIIDADTAENIKCQKCNSKMEYIGLRKELADSSIPSFSYIAICHCKNCGYEFEF